jgi:hypothetical protein
MPWRHAGTWVRKGVRLGIRKSTSRAEPRCSVDAASGRGPHKNRSFHLDTPEGTTIAYRRVRGKRLSRRNQPADIVESNHLPRQITLMRSNKTGIAGDGRTAAQRGVNGLIVRRIPPVRASPVIPARALSQSGNVQANGGHLAGPEEDMMLSYDHSVGSV